MPRLVFSWQVSVVLEYDPITDCVAGKSEALEALSVNTLLLERADQPLHHAVLLRIMRRDEFSLKSITSGEPRVLAG